MSSIISSLRQIVGNADFWIEPTGNYGSGTWDYGAMIEYFCAVLILCIVVSSIFRFLGKLVVR